ncbi:protein-glutamate methylesterase/protein-glutamine glutaminase [Ornithinibacillus halotolerans]
MRKMITDILETDNKIKVIATARNGEDGIQKIKELTPDVVTMDIEMPVMDGLTALAQILNENPVPVVMLTSVFNNSANKTVKAITSGAVDFIQKPSGAISLDISKIKEEIISKVISASQVDITKLTTSIAPIELTTQRKRLSKSLIMIGTSTGGPRALQQLIQDLPKDLRSPILIVQHMPATFTKSLAERLNNLSDFHIKEAVHNEVIKERTIYIAPGDCHMKVRSFGSILKIELTSEPKISTYQPSVDILLQSVANIKGVNKLAVILTGMGNDGSEGIKLLKEKDPNVMILAESSKTAIINGMPKAAIKTNAVDYIVPINQMGEMIHALTN